MCTITTKVRASVGLSPLSGLLFKAQSFKMVYMLNAELERFT